MAGEVDQPLSIILYDGPVKAFRKNVIEIPAIVNIKLEDFAAGIAASFKKAQENISRKLGEENFELEIEDFEIKTPYIVQLSDDQNLMMRLPQASETLNTEEMMFSKLKFKKTIKMK